MKTAVIGGTGHIGRFLVPMLVEQGCSVTVITRGGTPRPATTAWQEVQMIAASYKRADEPWRKLIAGVGAEAIVDILGSDVPGTYEAARGACRHYVVCGSVWMYGQAKTVPTPEQTQGPCEFEWYAMRYAELQATLAKARVDGVAFTAVMPPNICGPGKVPIDCRGGRDVAAHRSHIRGDPVTLPVGCQTLIGPCDASDVARGFALAVASPDKAAGEVFNVGPAYALTAPQLVRTYADIYGTTIPIAYVPWEQFLNDVLPDPGANFHFRGHMAPDISKIRSVLGCRPQFTPEQTLARAVEWMRDQKLI